MYNQTITRSTSRSTLAALRSLVPSRELTFAEALIIAERQATRLLELFDIADGPTPREIITQLPRIRIDHVADLPVSGASFWNGTTWVIQLNASEPWTRRRFTLAHEFKHILDHGRTELLYRGSKHADAKLQAEQAADFFAGCLLVPKRYLKRAWGNGVQRTTALARHFQVSPRALDVRLTQTGLVETRQRCETPARSAARLRYTRRST